MPENSNQNINENPSTSGQRKGKEKEIISLKALREISNRKSELSKEGEKSAENIIRRMDKKIAETESVINDAMRGPTSVMLGVKNLLMPALSFIGAWHNSS